jgi:solute carrier family 34 (sodium-dependent phosphate cotransporter)
MNRVLRHGLPLLGATYAFFLSIALMGVGMKASFKHWLDGFLAENAATFTELVSFVIGVLGTSLVQSSSTVTTMAVTLAQEGMVPLLIAIGIVHGANLGTSVTSSLVAFAAETQPLTGNPFKDARILLFGKRRAGFHRAVSTAVVHGMFNAILVTGILLAFELPFHVIERASTMSAALISDSLAGAGDLTETLKVITPGHYTKPVAKWLLSVGLPGWTLVIAGLAVLFGALKVFSSNMRDLAIGDELTDDKTGNLEAIGQKLLGTHPFDTFCRGLALTIMVQSSSATTALVVPLAAIGLFSVRRIFPFIMGANIGTTVTALLAAANKVGQPGFEDGLTIALAHLLLNSLAVVLVVSVPGLYTSIIGCANWLADQAVKAPVALLAYLFALSFVMPAVVFLLPTAVAATILGATVIAMLVLPHIGRRGSWLEVMPGGDRLPAKPRLVPDEGDQEDQDVRKAG